MDEHGPRVEVRDADGKPRAVLGSVLTDGEKAGTYTDFPPSTITLFSDSGRIIHQVPK